MSQAARVGLRLLPFQKLRDLCSRLARRPSRVRRPSQESIGVAVERLGRLTRPKTTCLTLALAAQVMLARRGYPAVVRIGVVRGDDARLQAHAWVDSGGRTLVGDLELQRYTPLTGLTIEDDA